MPSCMEHNLYKPKCMDCASKLDIFYRYIYLNVTQIWE